MFLLGLGGGEAAFDSLVLIVLALFVDAYFGQFINPARLTWHPLNQIRAFVVWFDRKLNRPHRGEMDRAVRGLLLSLVLLAIAAAAGWLIAFGSQNIPLMWILEVVLILLLIDQGGVYSHVRRIGNALKDGQLDVARAYTDMRVSPPAGNLDSHAIARLSIENCARRIAVGIVGPAFWYVLFGFPGLLVFRLLSVMDDIVGHASPQYRAFGFTAARINDILLYVPARISGVLVALASLFVPTAKPGASFTTMMGEAGNYRSTNLGWPVGAMAGALGLSLAGPRAKGEDGTVSEAWIGSGTAQATPMDIRRALFVFTITCLLNGFWVAALTVARLFDGAWR